MPKLPAYNQQQVQAQGTAGGMMNPNAPAGAFGAGLGQGIQQAAGILDQVQHQADVMRVESAANQLRSKQQELQGKVLQLRGQQAFDPKAFGGQEGQSLDQVAQGWFDEATREVSDGLSTDRQRALFSQASGRFRTEFGGQVQSHLNQETQVVANDTYKGALAVEDQVISQNGVGPDGRIQGATIAQSLARKAHAAEQLSAFLGEGEDMKKARVLEAQSAGHALVLDALLKRYDAAGARAYFDTNRAQMDPKVTSAMEGTIREAMLANSVQTHSDRISGMALPLDQQEAEARKAMAANPEGLKLLLHDLDHRWEVKKKVQAVAFQENTGKLWDMAFPTLPGQKTVSMPQIMRTPEWNALHGDERNALRSQWENYRRRNENDPSVQVERNLAYYNLVNDPGFATLTDNQIRAAQGKLGPQLTVQVMADLQKLRTTPAKVEQVKLDNDLLHSTAREMGIMNPNHGEPSNSEKAVLGGVATQLKMIQQSSKHDLTYDQQKVMLRQLMTPIVTSRPWYWSDSKQPLFQLQQTTPIPQRFTDAMNAKAQAKGVQLPSNAEIYQLYFDYKGQGLVDEQGNVK